MEERSAEAKTSKHLQNKRMVNGYMEAAQSVHKRYTGMP